jgi:hypothetical protein
MRTLRIAVACRNASGMSDLPVFPVIVTPEEYDRGKHYNLAENMAMDGGYERPFISFDDTERGAILLAAQLLSQIPPAAG